MGDGAGVGMDGGRSFGGIANAEAAAEINAAKGDAVAGEFADVGDEKRKGAAKGSEGEDLGADVRADAVPGNPAGVAMGEIEAASVVPGKAEFVVMLAGGDVAMASGEDVWIDAEGGEGSRRARSGPS